jgi:hypothetical protein
MPIRIEHIDKIARVKNRTVLFVSFEPEVKDESILSWPVPNHSHHGFESDVNRIELIKWLDGNEIPWQMCGHIASENGWTSYAGNIYVDVPWDESDPKFVIFQQRLENNDGMPKNPLVKIWACDLEMAMKNKHHDEPGFWENWSANY